MARATLGMATRPMTTSLLYPFGNEKQKLKTKFGETVPGKWNGNHKEFMPESRAGSGR